jgi:hypothetical protein
VEIKYAANTMTKNRTIHFKASEFQRDISPHISAHFVKLPEGRHRVNPSEKRRLVGVREQRPFGGIITISCNNLRPVHL